MTGKGRRQKGLQFERDLAIMLRRIYPEVKRHLESQSQEAKGYDLDNTGPYRIQAKCMAKVPNIPEVFKEFKTGPECVQVVMFKVTGKGIYAAFKVDDALKLIEAKEKGTSTPSSDDAAKRHSGVA